LRVFGYYFGLATAEPRIRNRYLWFLFSGGFVMKEGIHPTYRPVKVTCACGTAFETRSTKESIKLDICSNCHPFFTGKQKLIDTEGRVDKFRKKYKKA
jgi:large subunit ribosomal protein L31